MDEAIQLKSAIDAAWRRTIEFPYAHVCKHYAVMILGEELEKRGFKLNPEVIKPIVFADDDEALKFPSMFLG